jgi:general secretion pathway protein L
LSPHALPPARSGDWHWLRIADDGQTLIGQGSAPLALLPRLAGSDVALLLPAAAVSWHRVTLPPNSLGNAARLRTVLEGLLEDRLLDDAAQFHFALESGVSAGVPVWVAACERGALRAAAQTLEEAGWRVARIVPEFAPQSADLPPQLWVTAEAVDEDASPEGQFTVCDADGVLTLPLSAAGLAALNVPLATASVIAEPAVSAQAERALGRPLPIAQRAQRWLTAAGASWDLAQFEFASTGRARAGKQLAALAAALRHGPQWRAARWGVALLLAVQLAGLNAFAWQERGALRDQQQAINRVLTETFPSVKLVIDAPVQMTREVAALRQAAGDAQTADLEPLLGALADALPDGRNAAAIDFKAGQLLVRGLDLSPAEVSALDQKLAPRAYQARSQEDLLLVQAVSAEAVP